MVVGNEFHSLVTLILGKEPTSIHCTGGRVSSRAGVDTVAMEKSVPSEKFIPAIHHIVYEEKLWL
jgi:hypothetical protein